MRFPLLRMIAVAALAAALSGCYAGKNYKAYREELDTLSYPQHFAITWADWFADAGDIVSAEISFGEGIGAYVQPTKVLMVGVLFEDVAKVGFRQRGFGIYREVRSEYGACHLYYRDMMVEPIMGTRGLFMRRPIQDFTIRHNSDRHWLDLGAEAHVLIIGASAFVSPWETFDFVGTTVQLPYNLLLRPAFNLIGVRPPELDLSNDNYAAPLREKHGVIVNNEFESFPPAEVFEGLMDTPY